MNIHCNLFAIWVITQNNYSAPYRNRLKSNFKSTQKCDTNNFLINWRTKIINFSIKQINQAIDLAGALVIALIIERPRIQTRFDLFKIYILEFAISESRIRAVRHLNRS